MTTQHNNREVAGKMATASARPARSRWLVRLVSGLIACMATTVAVAQPAQAIPMSEDPNRSGCDANAVSLRTPQMPNYYLRMIDPSGNNEIGYAYLRYSRSCETQWVKVNYNNGYIVRPWVWKQNQSGTDRGISDWSPAQGTHWTWQLFGMRYSAGCGGVHVYRYSYDNYVGWYYLGCA